MTQPDPDNAEMAQLDALFAQASQGSDMAPSEAFMAHILQDALEGQPVAVIAQPAWWRQILSALGGWQGMGGLVAATCAGFWIGINPPDTMPASFETLLNMDAVYSDTVDTADLLGFGWDLEEG